MKLRLNILFQVASCTLDASTKIYSFRVDAVHSDVVQMASNIGRVDTNKKKRNSDEDGNGADGGEMDDDDDGPQSQALKKLKKKSRKVKRGFISKECLAIQTAFNNNNFED